MRPVVNSSQHPRMYEIDLLTEGPVYLCVFSCNQQLNRALAGYTLERLTPITRKDGFGFAKSMAQTHVPVPTSKPLEALDLWQLEGARGHFSSVISHVICCNSIADSH